MFKKRTIVIVLVILCIIIAIVPLLVIKDSEFAGTDDTAENVITMVDPSYEPWAESFIEPPGGEIESLLFSLQSAIGALILGGGFGYLIARNKYAKAENK